MQTTSNTVSQIKAIKNTKIKKLLHILADGNVHSGAFLGEALGVTRGAIWKLMRQLKEEMGIEVEAKTNQGYKICEKLELLDIHQIKAHLNQRYHPYLDKCLIFDQIPSTNAYLLDQLEKKHDDVYICLSEMQTAGRGRFNRRWLSPFGKNIYLSLLWCFQTDLTQLSGLSIAVAVSIVRALKKYGIKQDIAIKWPNDLVWQDSKLGGILIDLHGEFNHSCHAVIGVGLNCSMPKAIRETVDFSIADLAQITQSVPRRNQLLGLLLEELLDGLVIFQEQGLKPFMKEFKALDWTAEKAIKIILGDETFYGIGRGIDNQGRFLLEDAPGKIRRFSCGEAQLRVQNNTTDITS